MGIAWISARAEWRRRGGALFLLAVLVALAGGVTIAAAAGARRADTAFARFADATGEPDIQADGFAGPGSWSRDPNPAAAAAFTAAAGLPGVVRAQRFAAVAVAATEQSDAFAFAIVEEAGAPHHPFMVEGRMFDPDDPHEVVVNEAGAAAFGVGVGDRLVLGTIGWDQLDGFLERSAAFVERSGPAVQVTVTGIHRTAVDIAQQDDPFVTLSRAFVERYGDRVINCTCIDNFDAAPGRENEALAGVRRVYEPLGYEVDLEEGGALPEQVANGIDVEVTAMWVLALTAGVAGVVVVAQAIARQAAASAAEREIATALGATTRQQTVAGVLTLAPAIVVGAVGAGVLATGLSALTPRGLARRAEIDPGVRFDPLVLTIGAAAILALGAAIVVTATRRSVRRRPSGSPRFVALPVGVGAAGMLGIALATRPAQRGRLAAGGAIVATAMGVAGVLGVWSFEAGRQRLVSEGRLFGADADLAWRGSADDVDATVAVARSTGGVDAVGVRWALDADLTLTGPGGSATGNPSALDAVTGWAGPTIVRGRAAAGPDEVALGENVLAELDIDLGDTVRVGGPGGDAVLRVVGGVVAWGTDEVDDGFEVSMDGLQALARVSCDGRFACAPTVQHVVVRSDGDDVPVELATAGFVPVPLPSEIGNLDEAGPLPWMLAAFLAALAVAGLLHAFVTVLRVRRRDVVIGRALGLTRAGARSAARWTASTMTIAGVLIGVPIGIVVGRLVWASTAHRLGVVLEHGLPWWAPVLTALGALVTTLALAEIPARRAAGGPLTLRAE